MEYLATKHNDTMAFKQKQLQLEERKIALEEKKMELERLKWSSINEKNTRY